MTTDGEPYRLTGTGTVVVRVEPLGVSIEVARGETLMAAAERQGYRWPTVCHGQALCTVCFIEDSDAFEPPGQLELIRRAESMSQDSAPSPETGQI